MLFALAIAVPSGSAFWRLGALCFGLAQAPKLSLCVFALVAFIQLYTEYKQEESSTKLNTPSYTSRHINNLVCALLPPCCEHKKRGRMQN
jgi:hypothetical protein